MGVNNYAIDCRAQFRPIVVWRMRDGSLLIDKFYSVLYTLLNYKFTRVPLVLFDFAAQNTTHANVNTENWSFSAGSDVITCCVPTR